MEKTHHQAGRGAGPWAVLAALAGLTWQLLKGKLQIVLVLFFLLLLVPLAAWKWWSLRARRAPRHPQAAVDSAPGV